MLVLTIRHFHCPNYIRYNIICKHVTAEDNSHNSIIGRLHKLIDFSGNCDVNTLFVCF